LNAESWLDEDPSDSDGLAEAKQHARACIAKPNVAVNVEVPQSGGNEMNFASQ
jgi:hypothetical protein